MIRLNIKVKGIVQGVGFRPFIYNLAKDLKLNGSVKNTSDGVVIDIEGETPELFVESLKKDCPPLARIFSIDIEELPIRGSDGFIIVESLDEGSFTHISPDISVCEDCLREMFDSADRRHLYPFINCTNCGPRYTITRKVPYDRPNTTMSVFTMCTRCRKEYNDPSDRRFHAQPNACPECGPSLSLKVCNPAFGSSEGKDPLGTTIGLLKEGAIVAVKGLGGFHLCCDALNGEAVRKLRERKRRTNKPFALMAPDVDSIRRFCEVTAEEERVLKDRRRPILLLEKKKTDLLPEEISPNNRYTGFMLPYTPVHYLLFHYPVVARTSLFHPCSDSDSLGRSACFEALVMTSGNLSEEPIVIDNDQALLRLSGIADAFLLHDRDIFMRVDDSVVRAGEQDSLSFVRRARGFVPEPIPLSREGPEILGCGADLKNTFTITKGSYAVMSQHIGDMENVETVRFFEETLTNLKQVYRVEPVAIAHDLHPDYLSTGWAMQHSRELGLRSYALQHHYAHITSVMAEKGLRETVLGIAFDGTGYGTDGHLWGSEFLLCNLEGFRRAGHFKYVRLPGGESAIRECWRTAVSYLEGSLAVDDLINALDSLGFMEKYGKTPLDNVLKVLRAEGYSPLSCGAGRLFDAVSALVGACDRNTFEGEAPIALEKALTENGEDVLYPYDIADTEPLVIDYAPMIRQIVKDVRLKIGKGVISKRFHDTLIHATAEVARVIAKKSGIQYVALSGGVFQNAYLLSGVFHKVSSFGCTVVTHERVPSNDACISLGQAYVIRERLREEG